MWKFSKRQQLLGSDIVDAICARFLEVLSQANPQEIANLLYGLAVMGAVPSKQLLDGCSEHLASLVEHVSAQHIANTIWALGELGHCPSASTMQELLQTNAVQVCFGHCLFAEVIACIDAHVCRIVGYCIAARS